MNHTGRTTRPHTRRANVVALTAISLVMLLSFVALTIDLGRLYMVRAEMQAAADAASLAGVAQLIRDGLEDYDASARTAADEYARLNAVMRQHAGVDMANDVELGRSLFDPATQKYGFEPATGSVNAVRVTVRRTVPAYFAHIFGLSSKDMAVRATAAIVPRDISVVIDLSGSMRYDSQVRFYAAQQVNSRDIWAALDGPEPLHPYIPGAEHETEYAGDNGPAVGVLTEWGDSLNDSGYDPTNDPGLWHVPDNAACTEAAAAASLATRGYSAAQITALLNPGGTWRDRCGVLLGLATWTPSGAADTTIDNAELSWQAYPSCRVNWTWQEYISYVSGNMHANIANFQYHFGPKTFTEFLLEQKEFPSNNRFDHTPQQPLRAVKDGVQVLVNTTSVTDRLSLEVFNDFGWHEVDLTETKQPVAEALYAMQTNHREGGSTNMGEGLERAIEELTSVRARENVRKVAVLMSDGVSNRGPDPVGVAQQAADEGIQVYAVSVGFGVDRSTMQQIAAVGLGEEFYAAGDPEQYSAQLRAIFHLIGGRREAVLIE